MKGDEVSVSVKPESSRKSQRKSNRSSGSSLRTVGVATELRLISVDDVSELFHIAVLIHTHFRVKEIKPDSSAPDEFVRDDEYDLFLPKIIMMNMTEAQYEYFDITVRVNHRTGDVWAAFQNTCYINESLELQSFPFDRQLFRVQFKSPNAKLDKWRIQADMLDFPDEWDGSGGKVENTAPFLISCELNTWLLAGMQVGLHGEDEDPVSLTKGEIEITVMAQRDPNYYLMNYILVMFFVVLSNVSCIAMDPADATGDRLAVSTTLLLTSVAFKFVLAESLPQVGYQTWMDMYIMGGFIYLMVGALWNIVCTPRFLCMGHIMNQNEQAAQCMEDSLAGANAADAWFQLIFALLWFLLHAVITFFCQRPQMLRYSWDYIIDNQIGETEETIRRTHHIRDLDNPVKGSFKE